MIYVEGKKVVVLGAQRSGLAAARLLAFLGADVIISENNPDLETPDLVEKLKTWGVNYEFGEHSDQLFDANFAVISPGIPTRAKIADQLRWNNVPVVSEIEVAFWFSETPTIAITGSNGKTTTTELAADILKKSGLDAIACGNNGFPFCEATYQSIQEDRHPIYVVETSSFQLENIQLFAPHTAVLLNLSPNHLDRYRNFEEYIRAKINLFNNLSRDRCAVLNIDDPNIAKYVNVKAQVIPVTMKKHPDRIASFENGYFNFKIKNVPYQIEESKILLPGFHNKYNIMSAFSAIASFLDSSAGVTESLTTFKGIPHRLEYVDTKNTILFYNDSKSTTVDSVIVAIKSFDKPVHLILGGRDKGIPFRPLNDHLDRIKTIYTIGEASDIITFEVDFDKIIPCKTLDKAVQKAYESAEPGDIVLFSPGCASFDQYENFEQRGEHFVNIVKNLK
ncbi:MAG: UDP-N-acetylmuramoyl-L-alanine--D-glutamate ligase [Candidatus Marinimicrobia bacterium]|nr:UDP-N-acetylmuramoyl-L-alanine--D-glutamate ligase [Candidatus Neomarinimicrobiota bacterium]